MNNKLTEFMDINNKYLSIINIRVALERYVNEYCVANELYAVVQEIESELQTVSNQYDRIKKLTFANINNCAIEVNIIDAFDNKYMLKHAKETVENIVEYEEQADRVTPVWFILENEIKLNKQLIEELSNEYEENK